MALFWGVLLPRTELIPETLRDDVHELIVAFREEGGAGQLIPTLSRAAALVNQTADIVHWHDGVRENLVALVMRSVDAAEQQLGPKRGAVKRDFVIDVVLRVLSRSYLDFPLPLSGEAVLRPLVGVFVDWTVEVINTKKGHTWYPPRAPVTFWIRYRGINVRTLWRIYRPLLRFWVWFSGLFFGLTTYERQLRIAAASLSPQITALRKVVPVASLSEVGQRLVNIFFAFGELTKPHIRTIRQLIDLSRSERFNLNDPRERRQLIVAVLQELLGDVYRDHPFIFSLIQSDLGAFFFGELVVGVETVLDCS